VRVTEHRTGGWTHVVCEEDGWSGWLDGTRLASRDTSGDDLLTQLNEAMAEYSRLLDEHQAGTIDEATFHHRAVRIGLIVRDQDAWILDLTTTRWWRYDGVELVTPLIEDAGDKGTGTEK
jgi:hypothetical protein